jgi:hypothetical protein
MQECTKQLTCSKVSIGDKWCSCHACIQAKCKPFHKWKTVLDSQNIHTLPSWSIWQLNPKQPPCVLYVEQRWGGGGVWTTFPGTIVWLSQNKCRMTKKHHYSPKHHASEKLLTRTQTDARKSCMSRHLANQKASDIQLVSWSHHCSYFQMTG